MKPARGAFGANWAKLPGVNTHSVKIPKFPLKYSPITFISKIYQNLYFYLYGDTECSINLVDICAVGYTNLASIIHQWRQFYFIFLSVSTLKLIYIYQVAPWRGQLEKKKNYQKTNTSFLYWIVAQTKSPIYIQIDTITRKTITTGSNKYISRQSQFTIYLKNVCSGFPH